jgi:hypothetical protein
LSENEETGESQSLDFYLALSGLALKRRVLVGTQSKRRAEHSGRIHPINHRQAEQLLDVGISP